MATYIVGDLQGCYRELCSLLDQAGFTPQSDRLLLVGDIVARGPDSKACLDLVMQLGPAAQPVLGNHDLHLLAILLGQRTPKPADHLSSIVNASSAQRLDYIDWLRQQPLLYDGRYDIRPFVMTHAGIYPWWSMEQAVSCATELSEQLRGDDFAALIAAMYGNTPTNWDSSLVGFDRYRFSINAFTRMRFCTAAGQLDFSHNGAPDECSDTTLKPWFDYLEPQPHALIFGHWAALGGRTQRADIIGLDTGCVWGERLTMMNWTTQQFLTAASRQGD